MPKRKRRNGIERNDENSFYYFYNNGRYRGEIARQIVWNISWKRRILKRRLLSYRREQMLSLLNGNPSTKGTKEYCVTGKRGIQGVALQETNRCMRKAILSKTTNSLASNFSQFLLLPNDTNTTIELFRKGY